MGRHTLKFCDLSLSPSTAFVERLIDRLVNDGLTDRGCNRNKHLRNKFTGLLISAEQWHPPVMTQQTFDQKTSEFLSWFRAQPGTTFHDDIEVRDLRDRGAGRGISE